MRTLRTPNGQKKNSRPNNESEGSSRVQAPKRVNRKNKVSLPSLRVKAKGNPSHLRAHNARASDMRTGTLPVVRVQFLMIIIQLLQFQTTIPMLVNYLEGMLLILNCMTMTQWSTYLLHNYVSTPSLQN